MKVVLFCGGLGMRIREAGENVPKPMVTIGYRGDVIKNYFLNYSECVSNDFVLSEGGKKVELMKSDIHDWKITFVETGATANIGQRLKAVERHVRHETEFLANYSDGLTDLPLPVHITHFRQANAIASFVSVKPNLSYHLVSTADGGRVTEIKELRSSPIRINGGFFVFRSEIFDYIREGEELVAEPFQRLIQAQHLAAYEHHGFWMSMDTFKDRQQLEEIYEAGRAPWEVWNEGEAFKAYAGVSA